MVVPAASVTPVPRGASAPAAATLPMNGLTALEGLRLLGLATGSTLAVTGGAGLLASYVIGVARQRGIRVIADAGPGDEALVSGFGADHVLPRGDGFADAVRGLLPGGVDAVFDTAALIRAVLPAIRDGGAIAVVRGWDGGEPPGRGITVQPVSIGNWEPENYGDKFYGPVTLRTGFAHSLNSIAVQLAQAVGINNVIDTAHQLGVRSDLPAVPSVALGSGKVLENQELFKHVLFKQD